MKKITLATALASVTLLCSPQVWADSSLPAALPEFKDQAQMAQWTSEQTPQAANAEQATATFYTGKPYVADAGGYVYKYRTYNPEMSRWTSADPSGYPDGVNNQIYASNPVSHGDAMGLFLDGSGDPDLSYDESFWSSSNGAAVAAGWNITVEALGTAESGVSSATLSSSDTAEIKASTLYGEGQVGSSYAGQVYEDIHNYEASNLGANYPATKYTFSASDPDEYFGLHSLTFSTSAGSPINVGGTWTYSATVNLTKNWSFAGYGSGGVATPSDALWNAVGYRLQYYGYIDPFTLTGSFTDTWNE